MASKLCRHEKGRFRQVVFFRHQPEINKHFAVRFLTR